MSSQAHAQLQLYAHTLMHTGISGPELLASVATFAQRVGIEQAEIQPELLDTCVQYRPHRAPTATAAAQPHGASSGPPLHHAFQHQLHQMQQQRALQQQQQQQQLAQWVQLQQQVMLAAQPARAAAPARLPWTHAQMEAVLAEQLARKDSGASSGSTAALAPPAAGNKFRKVAPGPVDAVTAAAAAAARGSTAQPQEEEAEEDAGAAAVSAWAVFGTRQVHVACRAGRMNGR